MRTLKGFSSGYTKLCVQIHILNSRTAAAHVLKSFYNALLALLVVPANANDHEIFCFELGALVLNVAFGLKSIHKNSLCGSHLK